MSGTGAASGPACVTWIREQIRENARIAITLCMPVARGAFRVKYLGDINIIVRRATNEGYEADVLRDADCKIFMTGSRGATPEEALQNLLHASCRVLHMFHSLQHQAPDLTFLECGGTCDMNLTT